MLLNAVERTTVTPGQERRKQGYFSSEGKEKQGRCVHVCLDRFYIEFFGVL